MKKVGKGAVMQADRDGHAGSGRAGEKPGRIKGRKRGWTNPQRGNSAGEEREI